MTWQCDCPDCRGNHRTDPREPEDLLTRVVRVVWKLAICVAGLSIASMFVTAAINFARSAFSQ